MAIVREAKLEAVDEVELSNAYQIGFRWRGTVLMGRSCDTERYVTASNDPTSPFMGRVLNPVAWGYPDWSHEINRRFWLGAATARRPFEFVSSFENVFNRVCDGRINYHDKITGLCNLGGSFPEIVWPLKVGYRLVQGITNIDDLEGHAFDNASNWFLLPPPELPNYFIFDPNIAKDTNAFIADKEIEAIDEQYQRVTGYSFFSKKKKTKNDISYVKDEKDVSSESSDLTPSIAPITDSSSSSPKEFKSLLLSCNGSMGLLFVNLESINDALRVDLESRSSILGKRKMNEDIPADVAIFPAGGSLRN